MPPDSTIWEGIPLPADANVVAEKGTTRLLLGWFFFLLALVAVRMFLPFTPTDTMTTHLRVVESLMRGQNWGMQALVGAPEFPCLATLALLVARTIGGMLRLDPGRLLVSVSQVWAFCYVLRTARSPGQSWLSAVCVGLSLVIPDVRQAFLILDPNWIMIVPICSAVYHTSRWYRYRALRDAVVVAVNCGLLAFAGWIGVVFAMAVVAAICSELRSFTEVSVEDRGGIKLLMWAPFCYCLVLWLLWNWLIMGDVLFSVRPLWESICVTGAGDFSVGVRQAARGLSIIIPGGCMVLLVCLGSSAYGTALVMLGAVVAVTICRLALGAVQVFPAGGALAGVALGSLGMLLPAILLDWRRHRWRAVVGLMCFLLAGAAAWQRPAATLADEGAYMVPSPAPEAVTSWIDRFWPGSRVAVYGVRTPAIYHDLEEKRFVARMDFHPNLFLEQAADEQMHLLVPPRNGKFYARTQTLMSEIHQHGQPWLLLERKWDSGWQLWRCVIPPKDETKLRQLQ